ncbi:MAG: L-2-hydroxyglutarate oxidase [Ignavibacteriae bacterium]|nr:L-2-hydroxyglutarate oxidase [Ignavibacteriota bacterium]
MKFDFIIVGAGIVGLATALKIQEKNPKKKILIIEKERKVAAHQTGNNSGVIHSGIYYKPGSLKAKNCVYGYKLLLDFCDQHNVKYDLCGKVIVAVDQSEVNYLDVLIERGTANGLMNLRKITKEEINEIEPHVNGIAGIFVPQTGIIDYKEVSEKYVELILSNGGILNLNEEVINFNEKEKLVEVITNKSVYTADAVITCAGLHSDKVAKKSHPNLDLKIIPFRGEYYKIKDERKYLVKNLVYPVPDPAFPFLGVHFTRMIDGGVEAGPNAVLAFKREGYKKSDIDLKEIVEIFTWPGFQIVAKKYWKTGFGEFYRSFSKKAFVKALQRLIPEIQEDDLIPGGSGVRAQACDKTGGLLDDFSIIKNKRIVHVCNAPSPAATSSLAIGEHITSEVLEYFS